MLSLPRILTALPVAGAAGGALAATAGADSIVYVKDGNIWLTSTDAAKQYQATYDGDYSSPSQADDGTIVALHGKQFVRMNRSGQALSPRSTASARRVATSTVHTSRACRPTASEV